MRNGDVDGGMFTPDCFTQGQGLFFFPMDDKDFAGERIDGADIGQEIVAIGMGRKSVEFHDLRSPFRRDPEDRHHVPAFDELAPQRGLFR